MGFRDELRYFALKAETREQAVFVNAASAVKDSIVDGSPLTGSPGQPVDTGNLRDSWQLEFDGPDSALVSTNVDYAPDVEDNERGVEFHNHGPHSVLHTRANFQRLLDDEAAKVAAE